MVVRLHAAGEWHLYILNRKCLAGLTQQSVLLSWGGFFFHPGAAARREDIGQIATNDGWRVLDDEELVHLERPRRDSIGERSRSYGDAHVQVRRPERQHGKAEGMYAHLRLARRAVRQAADRGFEEALIRATGRRPRR